MFDLDARKIVEIELIEVGFFIKDDTDCYELDKSTQHWRQEKVSAFDLQISIVFEAAERPWRSMFRKP